MATSNNSNDTSNWGSYVLAVLLVASITYANCSGPSESERQKTNYECVTDPDCINGDDFR